MNWWSACCTAICQKHICTTCGVLQVVSSCCFLVGSLSMMSASVTTLLEPLAAQAPWPARWILAVQKSWGDPAGKVHSRNLGRHGRLEHFPFGFKHPRLSLQVQDFSDQPWKTLAIVNYWGIIMRSHLQHVCAATVQHLRLVDFESGTRLILQCCVAFHLVLETTWCNQLLCVKMPWVILSLKS